MTLPYRGASQDAERLRLWVLLGFGLTFLALIASWIRFPAVWVSDRTHGYVVTGLCGWLIWRNRAPLLQGCATPPAFGWMPALLLSLAWMFSMAASVQVGHLALAPLVLLAWLYAVRGRAAASVGAEIATVFFLAVPLWEAFTWPLQMLTVAANRLLLMVVRIPATVDGHLIHLPDGVIEVANSCAGLNYLMVGLTIGACYAYLFVPSRRGRVLVIVASGLVAMFSNWIRVFGLVLIGHYTQMQSPLMKSHVTYGWIIFALSMPLLFLVAGWLERRTSSVSGPPSRAGDKRTIPTELPSLTTVILATACAISGPAIYQLLLHSQRTPAFPAATPGIAVATQPTMDSSSGTWRATFTGAYALRQSIAAVGDASVQVDQYLYSAEDQEHEMVGSTNAIAADSLVLGRRTLGPLDNNARIVNEVALRLPEGYRLAWYWYEVNGVATASGMKAKLLELWSFVARGAAGQIVVVSTPCPNNDCQQARGTLFFAATGREMPTPSAPTSGR